MEKQELRRRSPLTTVESCCMLLQRDDEWRGVYDKWTVTQSQGYTVITGHCGETSTIVKRSISDFTLMSRGCLFVFGLPRKPVKPVF